MCINIEMMQNKKKESTHCTEQCRERNVAHLLKAALALQASRGPNLQTGPVQKLYIHPWDFIKKTHNVDAPKVSQTFFCHLDLFVCFWFFFVLFHGFISVPYLAKGINLSGSSSTISRRVWRSGGSTRFLHPTSKRGAIHHHHGPSRPWSR